MPVSFNGLMLRMDAPDFLADLSALSILGDSCLDSAPLPL